MTTDEQVKLARIGANYAARRDNGRSDPGEYLGAAWERVSRELARDPALPASHAAVKARQAAFDALRHERGWRGRTATLRPTLFSELGYEVVAYDRDDHGGPEERLLAAWCEYRAARADLDAQPRLWAYLLRVEGWTLAEVATLWGRPLQSVHRILARAGLTVPKTFTDLAG